jgi:predicted alpha/beta superfamily hydrolase
MGQKLTLYSNILKQEREIWINIPDKSTSSSFTNCPVLYLLDGEDYFNLITAKIRKLNKKESNKNLAKMIIVGIPNIDRTHDLTPTNDVEPSKSSFLPITDSLYLTSGGGDNFVSFIKHELIPYIDSLYQPSSERILAGHSFGGLLVVYTLLNYTDLFTRYIAIDPSIWWDHHVIVPQAKRIVPQKNFEGVSFFLANSSTTKKIAKSKKYNISLGNPYMIQLDFKNIFETNKQNKLKFNWSFYKNETHGTISKKAIFDGLFYTFN